MFAKELVRDHFPGGLWLVLNSVEPSYFKHFFHDLKITHFQSAIFLPPVMVFLLILGGFPAQIKLKISLFISWIL